MKKLLLFCSLCMLTFHAHGQDSLQHYKNIAYAENPSVKAAYYRLEAALQRIPQVKAMPNPELSFGFFVSPIETRLGPQQARVSLRQKLPWFGTLLAKGVIAAEQAEVVYYTFLEEKKRVAYQVAQAYYPLYELQEHIKWNKKNLAVLQLDKSLATTAFSNGKAPLTDALRIDIMLEETKLTIQLLEDQQAPFQLRLNRLLNRPDSSAITIPDSLSIKEQIEFESDNLTSKHPSLMVFDADMQVAMAKMKLAEKERYPTFNVGIDYAFVGNRTDANPVDNGRDGIMPMLSLNIPLAKARYQAAVKEQELRRLSIESGKEAAKNQLWTTYSSTIYQVRKAIKLVQLYEQQIEKTESLMSLLQVAYSNSGEDFDDILQTQQQLLHYRIAKATAIKEYYLALAMLNYLSETK